MSYFWMIYLYGIVGSLRIFLIIASLVSGGGATLFYMAASESFNSEHGATHSKWFSRYLLSCLFFVFLALVIPSQDTVKMLIAANLIENNQEKIEALPQEIRKFVVETLKEVKEAVK